MPETLDILILGINYAPEVTGVAPYTTGIARGLAAEGHRVQVLTSFPHYPAWKTSVGYEKGLRRREWDGDVEVLRVRHPLPRNSVGAGRVLMETVFAAQVLVGGRRRPDLIIVMSPALLSVASALLRRIGSRTAVGAVAQDLYSRAFLETSALGGRGARRVAQLERALLSRADGVAVIHTKFRDTLGQLGVHSDRITVIRNWAHIRPSRADPAVTRAEFGWSPDEAVVLHAGNMGHKQELENVIEAARLADSRGARVRFVLLGDGARRRALEEQAREVRSLEFVDPLPKGRFEDALAAADLLLVNEKPGVLDMCVPGKLTSYFAAGRPVLAATDPRSGAAAEVLASGGGALVAAGDPSLLLKTSIALADDPVGRAEMSERGRAYAEATLTPDAAIRSYEAWAHGLVRAKRGTDAGAISSPHANVDDLSPVNRPQDVDVSRAVS